MFKKIFRYKKIKEWYARNERLLIPSMLVLGVTADFVTFTSINITAAFVLLGVYALIAGGAILFLNAYNAETVLKLKNVWRYLWLSTPLVLQFAFGALLSASFIFYFFSGTIFISWPFIGLIVFLMISNEIFRHYYLRPTVQVGAYYFILFTLASIILPFASRAISLSIFIFSGTISLILVAGYIAILLRIAPSSRSSLARFAIVVSIIFFFMNGLYFLNIIPPIPLAIREAVLAHEIKRVNNKYVLLAEEEPFLERFLPGETFHKAEDGKVYVYTAIFAPRGLAATIVHNWQYYDEARGEWVSRDRLSFPITGGAKTGYRGFSVKSQVPPGRWRVDVETERGQVLGRISFRVLPSGGDETFKTLVK